VISRSSTTLAFVALLGASAVAAACSSPPAGQLMGASAQTKAHAVATKLVPAVIPADTFATLNGPAAAHEELCQNDGKHPDFPNDADAITKAFCQDLVPGGKMPAPTSLAELLGLLGLAFHEPNGANGAGGNPAFALLGHSSALTARKVSTLTPTAFVFTPPPPDGSKPKGYVFLAYDPGETFVEVASHDPLTDEVNFYLVLFDKECTKAAGGCTNVDLLTPKLVTGWSNVRVYESGTALNDTIADCRQCHAPRDSDPQILRMQEIEAPFTHWFSPLTNGGRALLADFHDAHGANEDYGPIPAALVDKSDPGKMAALVTAAGFGVQPNAFPSAAVEAEVTSSSPHQPFANLPLGKSDAWESVYDAAVHGQFIAPPYHDVKVTDPTKLLTASAAYRDWQRGARSDLPDVRDVFLDVGLADMGFAAKPGLDGQGLLVQLCQQCHNPNLDQTISRALFDVTKLPEMSRAEKDLAIQRILLPAGTRLRMPPALFHTVSDDEASRMIAELRK
jgi:hypothetical protein